MPFYSGQLQTAGTSANEIRNDQGLNDKEARLLIEVAATNAQLKINWGKPPESMDSDNGTVQKTYWDTESGLNGRGYFIYKKDILIGAGYGMAL